MRRVIQAGLGEMGLVWAEAVARSRQWEAAAYVDPDNRHLMAAAARHGMPPDRCFTSLREALGAVEADALLDVTPPEARRAVCEAAFRWDLDVLCEKPLAGTLRDARALARGAETAGCILMVAQDYRYQPVVEAMRRTIARGRIGDAGYVCIDFHRGPRWDNYREQMAHPLLLDMAIHHADLSRCLLGTDIAAVTAAGFNPSWSWFTGDAAVMAQWEMENGVRVSYRASWVSRGWETPWNGHWRIEGSKAALLLEGDEAYITNKPGSRRKIAPAAMARTRQDHLLAAFARSVDRRGEPETSARRNLNSLAATHAMVRAAQLGRGVRLSEVLRSP